MSTFDALMSVALVGASVALIWICCTAQHELNKHDKRKGVNAMAKMKKGGKKGNGNGGKCC